MKPASLLFLAAALAAGQINPGGPSEPSPTWSHDVAPIVFNNCTPCHQPGGSAPFPLQTFAQAAKRAKLISRLTQARVMPPWLPSGPAGGFVGERGLSSAEISVLKSWYEAGAPAGDLAAAPPPPETKQAQWPLGPPDLVVRMTAPYPVPAGSGDTYRAFPLKVPADAVSAATIARARIPESDLLGIVAVDIHPGNWRVLHHAHLWADSSGIARRLESTPGEGYEAFGTPGFPAAAYLGGIVPGTTARRLPPGIADVLPLGSDLVLQIHYSSSGKAETDQTEVGLYFAREPIKRTVEWLRLGSFNIEIPAGASSYRIRDQLTIPADCFALSISPHMHYLGREVRARAIFPDGSSRELLNIPRWDFRWQDRYAYKDPVPLPRGTRIEAEWVYDNSDGNPRNPSTPARDVHFGPNSSDEMCELHLFLVPWSLDDYPKFGELMQQKMAEKIAELTPAQRHRFGFDAVEAK